MENNNTNLTRPGYNSIDLLSVWFFPEHRPPKDEGDTQNFSIDVLMYSEELGMHTIGWFDFENNKWHHIGEEEFRTFKWTWLIRPVKTITT